MPALPPLRRDVVRTPSPASRAADPAPSPAREAPGPAYSVRGSFQGEDVIGVSPDGFYVHHDGRMVTPSLGMPRGKLSLDGMPPQELARYGITRLAPEPVPARASAGVEAPRHFEAAKAPEFMRRAADAPELPGAAGLCAQRNATGRTDAEALADLRAARDKFGALEKSGTQTLPGDDTAIAPLMPHLLASENARHPGLNAMYAVREDQIPAALRSLPAGGEGHIRFHLGLVDNVHSLAVDAFRHADGKYSLVAIDSVAKDISGLRISALMERNPGLFHGAIVIPTPNQAHHEGCRIYALHNLNAMRDYEPSLRELHKTLSAGNGATALPALPSGWKAFPGNTRVIGDAQDAFGALAGKFFKHMQVLKPKAPGAPDLLDFAEARRPQARGEAVNKKGQDLRARTEGQHPDKPLADFDRFDRSASVDRKRLVFLDRAIAFFERRTAAAT